MSLRYAFSALTLFSADRRSNTCGAAIGLRGNRLALRFFEFIGDRCGAAIFANYKNIKTEINVAAIGITVPQISCKNVCLLSLNDDAYMGASNKNVKANQGETQ